MFEIKANLCTYDRTLKIEKRILADLEELALTTINIRIYRERMGDYPYKCVDVDPASARVALNAIIEREKNFIEDTERRRQQFIDHEKENR